MQAQNGFFINFIRLAGPFWSSENKSLIRNQTLGLFFLTALQIGIAVVITEWSADLFNALEQHSMSGLLRQIGLLILIFAASMGITYLHLIIKRRLQISWRAWLTERVIGQWMYKGHQYQVLHIQTVEHDNPDGRIAEDIRISTEVAIEYSHAIFYSALLFISFSQILWAHSGVIHIDLGIFNFPIYGYLVWIAIIYSVSASMLGWLAGKPLTTTTNIMQSAEANFRFGLVKARENSQAIALIHAELNEQRRFHHLFFSITEIYNRQSLAFANILLFNSGYSVLSMAFPILAAAPLFILGSITLGALMQSVQAFQQLSTAISWPVNNMAGIAQWRASVERVLALVKALDDLEQEIARPDPHRILIVKPDQSLLRLKKLCLSRLDGEVILCNIDADINLGDRVLITGDAFTGARLFKAIAGLWPWGSGCIELPDNEPMFFMPPRPYLPDGRLHATICYPSPSKTYSLDAIIEALRLTGLTQLIDQLEQSDNWESTLTAEQQQRLGLVRLLLHKPKWVLLQEAFNTLSLEDEIEMFRLICQRLPDAALLTISHQAQIAAFHNKTIAL
jgi:putative ATP-binding cassette transporter